MEVFLFSDPVKMSNNYNEKSAGVIWGYFYDFLTRLKTKIRIGWGEVMGGIGFPFRPGHKMTFGHYDKNTVSDPGKFLLAK